MARPAKAPDAALLHEAALSHLARYPTTRAGLLAVLFRRIARWARSAEGEPAAIAATAGAARDAARAVVQGLAQSGVVDDAAFAASRARRLARAGRSRRAIESHLRGHGLAAADLARVFPEVPEAELTAALTLARKRHVGPFRAAAGDEKAKRRELALLARAGFSHATALSALGMAREDAEQRLEAARRAAV